MWLDLSHMTSMPNADETDYAGGAMAKELYVLALPYFLDYGGPGSLKNSAPRNESPRHPH